ncbi:MAG: hypothetical protein QM786_18010 [Breznakibacter sp.]
MKRIISISLTVPAMLFLLVLTVVPHHHHGQLACVLKEICEDHGASHHRHVHHPDGQGNRSHDQDCFIEAKFIAPRPGGDAHQPFIDSGLNHIYFPLYFLAAETFALEEISVSVVFGYEYGKYIAFYKPAESSRFHGLRAPPCGAF